MNAIRRKTRCHARGTITHEATMAIVIATTVLVGAAQAIAIVSYQRRDTNRRSVAIREVGNLFEEIASRPWNAINEEELAKLALSEECRSVLREPRLRVAVADGPMGDGKHISIEIDWLTGQGERAQPLRVGAWRYPVEEAIQ